MNTESTKLSESNASLRHRIDVVVAIAAVHANAVDSEARFPAEAFAEMRKHGLLGAMVPVSLGGEGASLTDVVDCVYQLGRVCASTAMIYAMHQIMLQCVIRHRGDSATLAALGRRVVSEQLLLASSTTEGKRGGDIRFSEAAVQRDGDRISLERQASVISYGAQADVIVTTARRSADAPGSDQVLIAFVKSDYTLTRVSGWSTMGMRGTCSEGFVLKASGSIGQIVPEPYEIIQPRTMLPTAHLLWGAVWGGIAAGAVSRAQAFVKKGMAQAGGQMPPGASGLTRLAASLRTLRALLTTALRRYESACNDGEQLARLDFQQMITTVKVEASELAVEIVLGALRVCGLSGYRCDGEFSIERSLRDVLSAPIMINNDRILSNLASQALLVRVPDSLHD